MNGRPVLKPISRSASATMKSAATAAGHRNRRRSAADIGGVEPRGLDPFEAWRGNLDARVVGGIGPRVLEDREAARDDDRHALGLQRHVSIVAIALRSSADVAVAETGDPAGIRDDLVIRA